MRRIYRWTHHFAKAAVAAALLLGATCVTLYAADEDWETYLSRNYENHVALLRCSRFRTDKANVAYTVDHDSAQAAKIRSFFRLDTIVAGCHTTWERTLALARFVNRNICHDNQKERITQPDAIGLWTYHKAHPSGFNCRYHSILLHELLLSVGIENRPVWCLPRDSADKDCHVVNHVWLPEVQKWVMVDSDGGGWMENEKGVPMNLLELREAVVKGHHICQRGMNGNSYDYLKYMAKNLYWFFTWQEVGYGHEMRPQAQRTNVLLVPTGFRPFRRGKGDVVTTDAERFLKRWHRPLKP